MEYAIVIKRLLCDFLKSWKEVSYWSYVLHMPPHEQRRFKKYSTLETWCRRISSRKEKWKRKENKSHPFLDFLQSTYFAAQLESLNTSLCPITSQFSENIVGMSFCDCRLSKPFTKKFCQWIPRTVWCFWHCYKPLLILPNKTFLLKKYLPGYHLW